MTNEYFNEKTVAEQKAHEWEKAYDDLHIPLQRHDFGQCSCKLAIIPVVQKVLNNQRTRLDKNAVGVVDRLRKANQTLEEDKEKLDKQLTAMEIELNKLADFKDKIKDISFSTLEELRKQLEESQSNAALLKAEVEDLKRDKQLYQNVAMRVDELE